ncbi:nuo-12 Acyl carrier protein [Candida maltosa Xu316]|uniref:Acyl carrier protein n=1 Tax=Candida maltosa (strain Xu316) TaxID=1245528 RepID=M3JXX1_CANMX|nr:Acyl carrier protein [Candida maltosa Xu316]
MFRTTLLRSLRTPLVSKQVIAKPSTLLTAKPIQFSFVRSYAGFPPLTRELARERILELLEGYDKVDSSKGEITDASSFTSDLGLDSLDVVEVVMELEHEFNIQIPDNEADSLKTVGQTIDYILSQPDAC